MSDDDPQDSSPGQLLRAQREQQGLSRGEVADRLCLNEQMVSALEADDYQHFVSVTYAIGHLRSYARLVALDDSDLVNRFYQKNPDLRRHLEPMIMHRSRQISGTDRPILFLNWLIGLTILVLVILWYRDNYVLRDSTPPEPLLTEAGQAEPATQTTEPPQEQAVPDEPPEPEAGADSVLQTPFADDPPADDRGQAAIADATDAAETTTADTADTDTATDENATSDQLIPGTGLSLLEVALVGGDSWMEIYDVHGEPLFFKLARDGLEQTLSGQGPFQIVIGNTPPVRLTYQGQQVDIEAHVGAAGTARFTLE